VRDASLSVKQAELDLEKAKQPSDSADILSVKSAIVDAEAKKVQNAQAVKHAFSTLLNTGLEALPVNVGFSDSAVPLISGTYVGTATGTIIVDAPDSGSGTHFYTSELNSSSGLVSTTIPQPIGDTGLYIKFTGPYYQTRWAITIPNPKAPGYLSAYNAYTNAVEAQVDGDAQVDSTIAQNNAKLALLVRGTDPLDIQAKELALLQKQNALEDARGTLANYSAIAPFDGVVAALPVQKGDDITNGATLATLISPTQIVQISVNEVDILKIKPGLLATLTFDAVDKLTLTGHVIDADTLGTVTSGVVTYKVKIAFDGVDERIKPNMSVNADILIDSRTGVATLPVSALKQDKDGSYYVERDVTMLQQVSTVDSSTPRARWDRGGTATTTATSTHKRFTLATSTNKAKNGGTKTTATAQVETQAVTTVKVPVRVGLMNDQDVEIIGGLSIGDDVIIKKVISTTAKTTSSAPSLFGGQVRPRG
jgi:multidrug efflux pump subunit AcrA (membrane-fusion protein)